MVIWTEKRAPHASHNEVHDLAAWPHGSWAEAWRCAAWQQLAGTSGQLGGTHCKGVQQVQDDKECFRLLQGQEQA